MLGCGEKGQSCLIKDSIIMVLSIRKFIKVGSLTIGIFIMGVSFE